MRLLRDGEDGNDCKVKELDGACSFRQGEVNCTGVFGCVQEEPALLDISLCGEEGEVFVSAVQIFSA